MTERRTAKKKTSTATKSSSLAGSASVATKAGKTKSSTKKNARAVSTMTVGTSVKSTVGKKTAKTTAAKKPATAAKTAAKTVKTAKAAPQPVAVAKPKTKTVKTVKANKTVKAVKKPVKKVASAAAELAPSVFAEAMFQAEFMGEDAAVERAAQREEKLQEVLSRLAVSSNRFDDMANLEFAADIVFNYDRESIGLLVDILSRNDDLHGPDAGQVLSEVGAREPELLEAERERLVRLVHEDNWSMLPAVMAALSPIGHLCVDELWEYRDLLWSVINDGTEEADSAQAAAIRLLAAMCAAGPDYARTLAGGLVDLLGKCLPKDVALFAEAVLPALGTAHSHRAKPVLDRRMKELTPAEVARLRRAVRMAQTGMRHAA